MGAPQKHLAGRAGYLVYAQPLAGFLQVGADQQRLAGANDVFSQAIGQLARALGQHLAFFDFQLEADGLAFLERDIEVAGVENLAQLFLHRSAALRPGRAAS